MANDIRIKISADNSDASSKLKSTQRELANVAVAASKADSSLQKVGKGSAQATNALTNLGRVVQDAPFGFIGIANNINTLIESFQRLKSESGSTGNAFKALISSIGGAGGLGLAVSLGSAALSLFGMAMRSSGNEVEKAKEKTDKYADSVRDAAKEVSKEYVAISTIVSQIKSETLSRQQRQAAIDELQRIAPEYFATLNKEKATIEQITKAYDIYTQSITKSVQSKVVEKQLEEVVAKRLELQKKAISFVKEEVDEQGKLRKTANAVFEEGISKEGEYQRFRAGRGVLTKKENLELINLQLTEKKLLDELSKIKPVDFKVNETKKDAETINDVLKKLSIEIALLNEKALQLGTDETKAKISAIESAIQRLVKDFKVDPKDTIIQKLFGDIRALNFTKVDAGEIEIPTSFEVKEGLKKARAEAEKEIGTNPLIKPVTLPFKIEDPFKEEGDRLQSSIKKTVDVISDFASNSLSKVGELLGNVFSEATDPIGSFFGSIASLLASSLKDLGQYLITASTLIASIKKALNAAFQSNPVLGIAVGIGLIAVGTALENSLPRFAGGVQNFSGGMAIVGERGPEKVILPKGSDVIPNHRLNNVMASDGSVQVYGRIVAEGSTLVTIIDRAVKRNSRNGQM